MADPLFIIFMFVFLIFFLFQTSNYCKTCERHFIGEYQWQLHLKSNKHKRRKEGLKKKAKISDSEASAQVLEIKDNETK